MKIEDEYAAFCFDEAVAHFGSKLESDLNAIEGKNQVEIERKQTAHLTRFFAGEKEPRFADPVAMGLV